jgi:hypothetical protein
VKGRLGGNQDGLTIGGGKEREEEEIEWRGDKVQLTQGIYSKGEKGRKVHLSLSTIYMVVSRPNPGIDLNVYTCVSLVLF